MDEAANGRDALDDKVNRVFAGKVVRKDLVRKVKVGANVPVFVLEYLLGKYCASSDEMAIQMGLQVVNDTLADNYIRPDEATRAQSRVKENGKHSFIDKVKVRLVDSQYWAEVTNFGHKFVHIPDQDVRQFDRLLTGGIWAQVEMRFEYDEETKGRNPFWIEKLTPIQLATFDLDEYRRLRAEFNTDEWLDFVLRSMGYEPTVMERRTKLLFLSRLIPLCERNYNLVELGPRGTGKSYAVQELSPYASLLTGPTTVANLFGHMSGKQKGMVMIWDVVGFDEVADLQKMPKEVITTLKTFCESGQFQRGQEAMAGYASIAMFGNTQQPIDVMVQTGHLFAPMPDVIRDDMAFIDRLHFYLPGWEVPKMRNEHFTDHYGFVIDYLAEALRELRKHNFTEIIDHYFSLGSHLNARDRKAVRRTVSGLVKILHPHGQVSQKDLAEMLELALEGRRRVKEQLKKMGSFEYHQTSFSYLINDSGEEQFVGVPEQGGRDMISTDPLPPGAVYTAAVSGDGTVGLYRVEVTLSTGTGKLKPAGGVSGAMKESVSRAFSFLSANKSAFGVPREVDTSDLHVEVINLLGNKVEAEIGVAFFVAAYSALRKAPAQPALLVLGDLSIQGNIKPVRSLTEPLQVAMDNGGKRALIPIENKRQFLEVNADVLEQVDPVFFGDMRQAAFKALGLN
ncbi:Lon protease [Thiorhodovibrio winogradskyi]|uniref:Lon protease n=1 Tax=Thiorhodovibrio winogradskyi TaxID=77007 RepID=A0ABZ0SI87_9GAMM|nr:protease Lon-related BREX system protein BrxL [Thiorhodovibrio winogradskyi]